MEGLEATEVRYSTLDDVIDYRIEAEYFDSKFLNVDKKLSTITTVPFIKVASFKNGRPYSSACFNFSSGVKVGKIGDITNKRDISSWEFVEVDEFFNQAGQLLTAGDILMTLTGDPPDVGRVNYMYNPVNATWNQRVAKIRLIDDQNVYIDNDVLYAILSTETVRTQLERYAKGIRQRNLGNESLERLLLPIISNELQIAVKSCVEEVYVLYHGSIDLYNNAENILREYLGLTSVELDNIEPSIKSITNSLIISGRLDAEYYQPKYDDLINLVMSHQTGFDKIENLYFLKDRNYTPEKGSIYKYIELSNIGTDGSITGYTEAYGEDLPSRARRIVRAGDLIISSLEGSLQHCAIIPEQYDGAICSTGFYVLTPRDINIETSLVLFKSQLVQELMRRVCSGSIMAAMNTDEFMNIVIPKIDRQTQHIIEDMVRESTQKREESIRLLELAKSAVEVAIEQGEDKALELLTQ